MALWVLVALGCFFSLMGFFFNEGNHRSGLALLLVLGLR